MSDEEFQKHTTTVSNVGGVIYLSLPNDQYIQMTPEQARQIASRLFVHAAEALGQERPEVVVFR